MTFNILEKFVKETDISERLIHYIRHIDKSVLKLKELVSFVWGSKFYLSREEFGFVVNKHKIN